MNRDIEEMVHRAFILDGKMKWGFAVKHNCESPIEQVMLAYLVSAMDLAPSFLDEWAIGRFGRGNFHLTGVTWPRSRLALLQQVQAHGYRVDFAIVSTDDASLPRVAIECDGHDFHDRTPGQASRDRARDRHLTDHGWTVIRFTGADICGDPIGCANSAFNTARRVIEGRTTEAAE